MMLNVQHASESMVDAMPRSHDKDTPPLQGHATDVGDPGPHPDDEPESSGAFSVHCAGERHDRLRSLHALGNEVLYGFIEELRIFCDCRQYHELGYPSLAKYCESEFGIARSTAHSYLRVAKTLAGLPRTRAMFRDGDLSWCQIREITRVATAETESAWIELALKATVRELVAERKQAEAAGRDAPVDRRYGLPNLMVHIGFDVTMEEKQRILAAFACVEEALVEEEETGGSRASRPTLLRWADAVLAGTVPVAPDADGKRFAPAQAILYRSDPETGRACVETEDGPVQVPAERIDELAPDAVEIEITPEDEKPLPPLDGAIDRPNTDKIRLQTLARDGLKCAHCGSRSDVQVHHKVYRADGGRTALYNLVPLCRACHALEHDGLLDIRGRPGKDLRFVPMPMIEGVKIRDVGELCTKARNLVIDGPPSAPVKDPSKAAPHTLPGRYTPDPEGIERRRELDRRFRMLATGLVRWGYTKHEAVEAVSEAYFELERAARSQAADAVEHARDDRPVGIPEITDEDILRLALFNQGRRFFGASRESTREDIRVGQESRRDRSTRRDRSKSGDSTRAASTPAGSTAGDRSEPNDSKRAESTRGDTDALPITTG